MKDQENTEIREVTRRLDAVLSVLLETVQAEGKKLSLAKRVEILHTAGLRPSEIARILGKTATYVNVELTRIKSKARPRQRK
jgi:hypothetical protein